MWRFVLSHLFRDAVASTFAVPAIVALFSSLVIMLSSTVWLQRYSFALSFSLIRFPHIDCSRACSRYLDLHLCFSLTSYSWILLKEFWLCIGLVYFTQLFIILSSSFLDLLSVSTLPTAPWS